MVFKVDSMFQFKAARIPAACKGTIPVDYFPVVPDIDHIERVLKENGFVKIPNEPTDTYEQIMYGLVSVDGTYSLEGSYVVGSFETSNNHSMRWIRFHAVDSKYIWFVRVRNDSTQIGGFGFSFIRTEIVDRNKTGTHDTIHKIYGSYTDLIMEIKQLEQ